MFKSSRRGQVPPFIVMDVMRAAAEREATGADVLHLEVGQPSTGAPRKVIEAAEAVLRSGDALGYTLALGIPELREAIARHYRDWYSLRVDPERVVVTTGSSGAFLLAFLAAFDAGARVAMASPAYPAYKNILRALNIEPVEIPAGAPERWQAVPDLVRRAGKVDGLIIASPANPTGTMLRPDELADIVRHCAAEGIRLVSDEIYHGLTYGPEAATALSFGDDAIVVNSFSKYFSMTGWRLGWMVVPPALLRAVECLAQNLFISPPSLSQRAAIAVFDAHEELQANRAKYARNRALLLEELPRAGFDRLAPADGAFYLYADIGHLTNDSEAFCRRMLQETGIAATPGVDFDPDRGSATMRFSFAGAEATMAEAARRLRSWKR
jgi:aspartate/methionine/tyrosine aminotransferase